jgi:hypothetical protein
MWDSVDISMVKSTEPLAAQPQPYRTLGILLLATLHRPGFRIPLCAKYAGDFAKPPIDAYQELHLLGPVDTLWAQGRDEQVTPR